MSTYERYQQAEHTLNEGFIRVGLSRERENLPPRDPSARMAEMQDFLAACGDPQRGIPAVHVGGTSGKGSVCAMVTGVLVAHGLKVGLHVTPYLQSATEKIWIDRKLVSAADFADLLDWIEPIARPRVRPETPASIHGMASVTIAFEAFRRAAVDVMVYEVGCGGRFDLTSFVDTTVAVVTNVGLDHVVSLGPDLEKIAWHKAGIARAGAPLVTGATGVALDVITREAETTGAPLVHVPPDPTALHNNRQVALEAARQTLTRLGVEHLPEPELHAALDRVRLPARTERMPTGRTEPTVILDGAHNADKLAVAVQAAFPEPPRKRDPDPRIGILGFLGSKVTPELLRPLAGKFDRVIATEPQVYGKSAYPAGHLAELLREIGYDPHVDPDPIQAMQRTLAAAPRNATVLATGSFYLAGNLRDLWYAKAQVVEQRTSWPKQEPKGEATPAELWPGNREGEAPPEPSPSNREGEAPAEPSRSNREGEAPAEPSRSNREGEAPAEPSRSNREGEAPAEPSRA